MPPEPEKKRMGMHLYPLVRLTPKRAGKWWYRCARCGQEFSEPHPTESNRAEECKPHPAVTPPTEPGESQGVERVTLRRWVGDGMPPGPWSTDAQLFVVAIDDRAEVEVQEYVPASRLERAEEALSQILHELGMWRVHTERECIDRANDVANDALVYPANEPSAPSEQARS